jgi:hypothetical protein
MAASHNKRTEGKNMSRNKPPFLTTLVASVLLLLALVPVARADSMAVTQPSELAIVGDIAIARPLLIAITGAGMVVYTVTLPFSILGGNEDEMAEKLVRAPARSAFLRCLGCTPAQDQSRHVEKQIDNANKKTSKNDADMSADQGASTKSTAQDTNTNQ